MALTEGFQLRLSLEPAPPWLGGWQHDGPELWPPADDLPDDLNAIDTPWLDSLARGAAAVLRSTTLPNVVGHADWGRTTSSGATESSTSCMTGTAWPTYRKPYWPVAPPCSILQPSSRPPRWTQSEAFIAAYEARERQALLGGRTTRRLGGGAMEPGLRCQEGHRARRRREPWTGLRKDGDERLRRAGA